MSILSAPARGILPKVCQIYIISEHENGPIKIGRSVNAYARIEGLQTGNPRKLRMVGVWTLDYEDALRAERMLHEELAEDRLEGEWFERTEAFILEYMPDFFGANGWEPAD